MLQAQSTNWKNFFLNIDVHYGVVKKDDWEEIKRKKNNEVEYILSLKLLNQKMIENLNGNEMPSFDRDGKGTTLREWAKQNNINLL